MNIQVGKSTGIALLLAAGLLAALFAMGVFSAQGVLAEVEDDPAPTVELSDALAGIISVTMTVTFQLDADATGDVVITPTFADAGGTDIPITDLVVDSASATLGEAGVAGVTSTAAGVVNIDFDVVAAAPEVNLAASADKKLVVTILGLANPEDGAGGAYTASIVHGGDDAVTATATVAVATAELSSLDPGAVVQIELRAVAATAGIKPGQDITVDLTGFGMPATMADSAIDIVSAEDDPGVDDATGFRGSPRNVLVTGNVITMTVPNVNAAGTKQEKAITGPYSIKIKQAAGITNPAAAGSKTITLEENAPVTAGDEKAATAYINRVVKLDTTAGTRGTVATATFKGFANGTATVNLNGDKLDEVTIAENLGTLAIDTTSSDFEANRVVGKVTGNEITAQDSAGASQDVSATFTISPKVVLDPEETSVSKEVTVKLSDWPTTNRITAATVGASDVMPSTVPSTDAEGKAEFKVTVPQGANRGTQTVKVTGTEVGTPPTAPSATASLKIGVLTLTAQPAMVVPGQQITIQGSGFVSGDSFGNVSVGGIKVSLSPEIKASSAGDIVITINVPSPATGDGIGDGEKTITVTATGSGRVAEGSIDIPKAAITLTPENSRRGTTVNVSGTGFPSGDLVQVKYGSGDTPPTVAAGSADASGAISVDFDVPSFASIGAEHNVQATSVGVFAGVTAEATHETPGATVTLSASQIASGQQITISGLNFPAFATVATMEIGSVDVRPVPAPATSINGDFESTVLVPQLELGNQTVSIRVSSTTITTFLELVEATAAVSTDPAEIFGGLGDRLVRVWHLERSTQVWSFYDPDPDVAAFNTLTEVPSGQNVSIIISAGDTIAFQSDTLYQGTNPIGLE